LCEGISNPSEEITVTWLKLATEDKAVNELSLELKPNKVHITKCTCKSSAKIKLT